MIAGYEITWAARQHGVREVVVFGTKRLSAIKVNQRANMVANALVGLGLDSNHRVAVLLNNSLESLDTVIGVQKAGVTFVALNARYTAAEHKRILEDAEPTIIIAGPEFENILNEAIQGLAFIRGVYGIGWHLKDATDFQTLISGVGSDEPNVTVELEDLMRLHYTSGTTGEPKGVMITYEQYYARMNNYFTALHARFDHNNTMIHAGPLTHAAGNYLIPCLVRGVRSVIMKHFDVEEMQILIERERVTDLFVVPTMLINMIESIKPNQYDLTSVQCVGYGAAPMPVDVLRKGIEIFGLVFREHYGMSEHPQPVTVLYPHEHVIDGAEHAVRRLASCGRATVHVNMEIRDTNDVAVPQGEVGEVCIEAKGASVTHFWKRPDLDAKFVRNDWLHTDDLGWMDEEGYLFIVGRLKDMIITGGFNVYAREVEDVIFDIPGILEAAVIGVPDPKWGEAICAYVVVNSDAHLTKDDITKAVRDQIASYKKPKIVKLINALPRNATGKVDKEVLRKMAADAANSKRILQKPNQSGLDVKSGNISTDLTSHKETI